MNLQQIHSGNYVTNFIRIARVLQEILQKICWSLFSGYSVYRLLNISHYTDITGNVSFYNSSSNNSNYRRRRRSGWTSGGDA